MSIHEIYESIGVEHSSSSVAIHINDKLVTTSSSFPIHTIFKVHTVLRRGNEAAYEPNMVAIGPYHRGKDRLQVMEDRKLRWFKSILEERGESDATKYVEAMRRLEPEARQCYSENTQNIKEDEFVEMLLLDACFIIQFMRWYLHGKTKPFFHDWSIFSSIFDMLLFENQIPLFVVQELFSMIKLSQEPSHFHDLALEFLIKCLGSNFIRIPEGTLEKQLKSLAEIIRIPDRITGNQLSSSHNNDLPHILGLSHYILRGCFDRQDKNVRYVEDCSLPWEVIACSLVDDRKSNHDRLKSESIPSAVKLHAAGIKFKRKEAEGGPFEINFQNGVMEISKIDIDDGTERLYRNLIAYEQYNQEAKCRCVSLHAKLLDCLIDSANDVALLRSFGIVGSFLGEDEAISSMFNKLVNEVCVSNVHFNGRAKLFEEVNAYCGKRRHRWMAKLKMDYFNSPWALISFLGALFLLLLTLTQTVFSILSV